MPFSSVSVVDFEQVNVSWVIDLLYVSKGNLIIPKRIEVFLGSRLLTCNTFIPLVRDHSLVRTQNFQEN